MGTSDVKELPLEWSATENIAWKTQLPGPGRIEPDRVRRSHLSHLLHRLLRPRRVRRQPEDLKRHLIASDRSDGEIVWDRPIAAKLPEEDRIRDHGLRRQHAGGRRRARLRLLRQVGRVRLRSRRQAALAGRRRLGTHGWGSAASPVLYNDLVFINASVESDSLVALDRSTGKEKWRGRGIRESWNTPRRRHRRLRPQRAGRRHAGQDPGLRPRQRRPALVLQHRHRLVHGPQRGRRRTASSIASAAARASPRWPSAPAAAAT